MLPSTVSSPNRNAQFSVPSYISSFVRREKKSDESSSAASCCSSKRCRGCLKATLLVSVIVLFLFGCAYAYRMQQAPVSTNTGIQTDVAATVSSMDASNNSRMAKISQILKELDTTEAQIKAKINGKDPALAQALSGQTQNLSGDTPQAVSDLLQRTTAQQTMISHLEKLLEDCKKRWAQLVSQATVTPSETASSKQASLASSSSPSSSSSITASATISNSSPTSSSSTIGSYLSGPSSMSMSDSASAHPPPSLSPSSSSTAPGTKASSGVRIQAVRKKTIPTFPPRGVAVPYTDIADRDWEAKALSVKQEFVHAYAAYERHAFGLDDLHPLSTKGSGGYNMGLTMVDSLDTMLIMGLKEEFDRARQWISTKLKFDEQEDVNMFECTIRVLGGLLSAYALSGDAMFLHKAQELADAMLMAFETPTGIPFGTLGLRTKRMYNPSWSGGSSSVAEVATIQLEFAFLSRATGNPLYENKAEKVVEHLHSLKTPLYTQYIDPKTGAMTDSTITFGARVDSTYEYFLKNHLLSGKTKALPRTMYLESMRAMIDQVVLKSNKSQLLFVAEKNKLSGQISGKMDHLVCFVPGMLALGVHHNVTSSDAESDEHMAVAKGIMETCWQTYKRQKTGLAPEISQFHVHHLQGKQQSHNAASSEMGDFYVDPGAKHNLLRPETVESLFVLWRITRDEKYRAMGWEIFKSFVQYGRVPQGGYSSIRDVTINEKSPTESHWSNWRDHMESFFLAETLKYLYLLFSDVSLIDLDHTVLNTEAHPLPIKGLRIPLSISNMN